MWWGLKSHLEKRMLAAPFSVGRLYQGFWLHSLLCWAGSSSCIWLTFLTASCLFFLSPFTQAVWGKIWTYTPCVWRMTQDKETASKWSLERQETEHTGKRATHGGKRPERKKKNPTTNNHQTVFQSSTFAFCGFQSVSQRWFQPSVKSTQTSRYESICWGQNGPQFPDTTGIGDGSQSSSKIHYNTEHSREKVSQQKVMLTSHVNRTLGPLRSIALPKHSVKAHQHRADR